MKDRFISLGCTFRELLLCCDWVEVATLAATRDCKSKDRDFPDSVTFIVGQVLAYERAITEILSYDECTYWPMAFTATLVLDDPISCEPWVNVNLFNWEYVKPPKKLSFDKWEDKHHRTFSATFSKWAEHGSREVLINFNALKHFRTLEEIASEIMWEVTFNGFTGKETADEGEKVMGECKEVMEEFKLHPEKFETFDPEKLFSDGSK